MNLTGSPMIDLSTPTPGPPVVRQFHQHEGFYVRASAGLGTYLGANLDVGTLKFDSSGLTLDFDVLVGGGPAPGFTLGGAVLGSLQLSGDWSADGGLGGATASLSTLLIGPFADGFPDSKGGWHFGGMAGLARVGLSSPSGAGVTSSKSESALGFGGAFWVGDDIWVAPEWSVGGQLRLNALRATNSDDEITVTAIGASLMFTVLYN